MKGARKLLSECLGHIAYEPWFHGIGSRWSVETHRIKGKQATVVNIHVFIKTVAGVFSRWEDSLHNGKRMLHWFYFNPQFKKNIHYMSMILAPLSKISWSYMCTFISRLPWMVMGEKIYFSKQCWENWIFPWKRITMNHFPIHQNQLKIY